MTLHTMTKPELVAYINGFTDWDETQYDALCELAARAGLSPDDYRDYAGDLNTHDFVVALQDSLGIDLVE